MSYDVITFGEAMVRLSPANFRRLEQAHTLDAFAGGAELNTAVALARLGKHCAWVTRLTDNAPGRFIASRAREAGVNIDHVIWTPEDRVGLYFVEFGAAPRASSVLYDRKDSAMAKIRPGLVPWDRVLRGVKWFHVTGITPALSSSAAEATREALEACRTARVPVSLDLNYRAKLWTKEEARRTLIELLPYCEVLITTEEDAERVLNVTGSEEPAIAAELASRFSLRVVAITIRDNPLVWKNSWTAIAYAAGVLHQTRSYEVEIVDRLGAGDSFAAGLIHGLLDGDLQKGLDYGVAASALKHSIAGDFAWITCAEVESLLKGHGLRISR
jgi:2-dehydro-3-deoxygluconokinase